METTMVNVDDIDLNNPDFYNNRELSWLAFNERVLEESLDERNPLLEQLKFIAICSSNLDEFFMVRVGSLKDQVKVGYNKPENKAGLTPREQLALISEKAHEHTKRQYDILKDVLLPKLEEENIFFTSMDALNSEQEEFVKNCFYEQIFPVLTPLAIDAYRPFPKLLNKSLNLAVQLKEEVKKKHKSKILAIVQVPNVLNRYISLPSEENKREYILLEDIISHYIGELFTGYEVQSVSPFRITRNAEMEFDEEGASDFLREIEKEIRKRKWGSAVRLEYEQDKMDKEVYPFLKHVLELSEEDIYVHDGPLDLTFLFSFVEELGYDYEHLVYETFVSQTPKSLIDEENVMEAALKKDLFFHHPYESFQPIIDFIQMAAEDSNVLAIKQTLYRVSGHSPIIAALAQAAEAGKQVTVLVELKARFDEENNIQWAKMLEQAGVHVIYGITGLKTHSKITLVVRQGDHKIQRFVHLSTGNYNESTAKLYTDMSIVTTKEKFGVDATNFFNYLTGYSNRPKWNHFAISPHQIRQKIIDLIDQEIETHRAGEQGHIVAKMNSLTDKPIILKLYEASRAGVKIDLIVRGICCLRPGIPNVSENITVRSIVGRFLEHSRIFYFHHGGEEKVYLSSADWMTRNMENRIEIIFPILQKDIKKRVLDSLDIFLKDNVKAREQDSEGNYHYVKPKEGEALVDAQQVFREGGMME